MAAVDLISGGIEQAEERGTRSRRVEGRIVFAQRQALLSCGMARSHAAAEFATVIGLGRLTTGQAPHSAGRVVASGLHRRACLKGRSKRGR